VTHSVVVVDDEPTLRKLLVMLLHRDGRFEVLAEASDGPAALAAVAQHDPDLLLLDLGLPGMDGLEVLAALDRPRPAVVVLTGFADEATLGHARELGAAACLVKGVDFQLIGDALVTAATDHDGSPR
jgi:DNA-binding NarL/FixJ family response regulator